MTTTTENPFSLRGDFQYHSVVGMLSAGEAGFSGPVSIALRSDGMMYVASRGNPNQQESVRVTICTKDGEFVDQFGGWGEAEGQFIWVTDISFNQRDELFLSDENTNRISVFSADGAFLRSFGEHGNGPGQFDRPSGLAFDEDDNLFVVDSLNHRIQKLDQQGTPLDSWGRFGTGDGEFNMPWGITFDSQGDIFITDWRNDRVQKFAPDGSFLTAFGKSGTGEGEFDRPNGITVDSGGDIYVCDWRNDRVQVFEAAGRYKDTLIGHCGMSKWARTYFEANPEVEVALNDATQNIEIKKRFYRPTSVITDDDGKVYVVDCYRHRIQIYQKL